ncbi:MAG: 50S ribosomal protein L25 [Anaerolineales bacterium]|nr:50S ribosomal protein L25 [Anaerolineales bacterium]
MTQTFVLEANKREMTGKRVRQLRAQGRIPAVVYGPQREPVHIVVDWPKLRTVLANAGSTHLVEVQVDSDSYTTLIREVDRHPIRHEVVLHVDFYAVNLQDTLVTSVPIVLLNEDKTASRLNAQIIHEALTVEVECLPTAIPEQVQLDVAILKEAGDFLTVANLPQIEGVSFVDDPDTIIVRTTYIPVASDTDEEEEGSMSAEPEVISRRKEEDFDD